MVFGFFVFCEVLCLIYNTGKMCVGMGGWCVGVWDSGCVCVRICSIYWLIVFSLSCFDVFSTNIWSSLEQLIESATKNQHFLWVYSKARQSRAYFKCVKVDTLDWISTHLSTRCCFTLGRTCVDEVFRRPNERHDKKSLLDNSTKWSVCRLIKVWKNSRRLK